MSNLSKKELLEAKKKLIQDDPEKYSSIVSSKQQTKSKIVKNTFETKKEVVKWNFKINQLVKLKSTNGYFVSCYNSSFSPKIGDIGLVINLNEDPEKFSSNSILSIYTILINNSVFDIQASLLSQV